MAEQAIEFSENFAFPTSKYEPIIFEANSYQQWADSIIPQLAPLKEGEIIKLGSCELLKKPFETHYLQTHRSLGGFFPIPEKLETPIQRRNTLKMFQGGKLAYCGFSDRVLVPILRDPSSNKFWMSLTPMEIASCRGGIPKAHGRVLLAGVGLSWMAQRIAQRRQVTKLTIVEINPGILAYFGEPLKQQHPDKIELVPANVWKYLAERDWHEHDSYIFDIWEYYGRSYIDPDWEALKEKAQQTGKRAWAWGDVKNMPPTQ